MSTPLIDLMRRAKDLERYGFHTSAHHKGLAFPSDFDLSLDTTETDFSDDLLDPLPGGAIAEAEALAARYWGADGAVFLAGGTTLGIQASVYAMYPGKGRALLWGPCHQAIFHILDLLDIPYDHIPFTLNPITYIKKEEEKNSEQVFSLFLCTSPDYYGRLLDLAEIRDFLDRKGIFFILDKAHGAHLAAEAYYEGRSPRPEADIELISCHKTLPALTGAAIILVKRKDYSPKLRRALRIFSTSSPSLLIAASNDYARAFLETQGKERLASWFQAKAEFVSDLPAPFKVMQAEKSGPYRGQDPLRLVIDTTSYGPGTYLYAKLLQYGLVAEMADLKRVVFILGPAQDPASLKALTEALEEIGRDAYRDLPGAVAWRETAEALDRLYERAPKALRKETHERSDSDSQAVELRALDKLSPGEEDNVLAGELVPYPPGIPIYYSGETLKPEEAQILQNAVELGLSVRGLEEKDDQVLGLFYR